MSSPATTDQTQSAEQHNRDHRQQVTDSIISLLEQGVAPWQKPWEGIGIPLNPTTGKAYRGGNAVHLMATALQRGYGDPRWMTYKQAAENDWQVKKGEKGTQIEFWEVKDPTREKTEPGQASDETPEKPERRFIHKIYTVFNAQQIDGIPPHVPKERNPFEAVEAGERILASSGANISHDQADRAFYNRRTDSIHLPARDAFDDAPGYYGTALHELSHWTGHPSRLNRSTLNESYRFGDPAYAREELRAELASLFISADTGIPHDPTTHAAYVGSWVEALRKDKNEIFRAAHDASAAADFVLSRDPERAKNAEQTAQSTPERESSRFAARMEPGSGTVSVHDKRFGNDHHTPIDPAERSSEGSPANRTNGRSELSESFQEARALAIKELGHEARTYVAQTNSGIYSGKIIGETEHHVLQRLSGQTAVTHLKKLVGDAPELNSTVSIAYRAEKARVREIPEREKTAELAR